jgi:hypothetical protein
VPVKGRSGVFRYVTDRSGARRCGAHRLRGHTVIFVTEPAGTSCERFLYLVVTVQVP